MADIEQLQKALINADSAGDVEAARMIAAEIKKIQSQQMPQSQPMAQQKPPSFNDRVYGLGEAVLSQITGALSQPVAGIYGMAAAANPFAEEGAGGQAVRDVQQALTYQPRSEIGKAELEQDVLRPVAEEIKEFREGLGQDTLNATGSEFLASIAQTLPDATLSILGVKGLTPKGTAQQQALTSQTAKLSEQFSKMQTPTKQKISQMIVEGSRDADIAGVQLKDSLLSKITDGLPRVVKDKKAMAAIDQGLPMDTAALIKTASKADKAKFKKILDIAKKSLSNREYRANNRTGDVAGESLLQRVKAVRQINKRAGQNVKNVAESDLKGVTIDKDAPIQSFLNSLSEMDINTSGGLRGLNYSGSAIEGGTKGAKSAQSILNVVAKRLEKIPEKNNAKYLHNLKQFIDKQVEFGKTPAGGKGAAESALKSLRREINQALGGASEKYASANAKYSSTIEALGDLEKAAGSRLNLMSESADKALGVSLRRLTGNTQSRANLIDAMKKLENVAIENGVKFKDRIIEQVLVADDIENLLKISPATAFKGQVRQAAMEAATGQSVQATATTAKTLLEKMKSKTPEKQIKAIQELLNE